jgi:hypothetical protein
MTEHAAERIAPLQWQTLWRTSLTTSRSRPSSWHNEVESARNSTSADLGSSLARQTRALVLLVPGGPLKVTIEEDEGRSVGGEHRFDEAVDVGVPGGGAAHGPFPLCSLPL